MKSMKKSLLASALLASTLVGGVAVAGAQDAGRAEHGKLVRFAGAPASLEGHAQLVRTGDGKTIVSVHVRGLEARETYGSHVHNLPCNVRDGGGHYLHDGPTGGGSDTEPNGIWPGPITTNAAGVGRGRVVVPVRAGDAAVSVVVHAPGGAKIACADLAGTDVVQPA